MLKRIELDCVEWKIDKVPTKVTLTSWIKDMNWANAGLDIIMLTSLNEGAPIGLIEAKASNKPIVTKNVGGLENVVLKNETAFITESNKLDQFVGAILKFVENDEFK